MKLANVGYILKNGNVQWRLLDLDGINGKSLTFPYTFWRGRDLGRRRGMQWASLLPGTWPQNLASSLDKVFPATFKPNECNMVLGEFLLPSIKLLKNWSRTPIPIFFFRIFKRVLAADGRFYWSIARHSFRRGRPAARGPPQSRRRGRRQKDLPRKQSQKISRFSVTRSAAED